MADITILDGERHATIAGTASDGHVRVAATSLEPATGWELKPEGLCRGDMCVPVRDRSTLVVGDAIDLSAFAAAIGRPAVVDADTGVVALGASVAEVSEQLRSLDAPDFTLTDIDGNPFRFSSLGRKKKLLVAWASW